MTNIEQKALALEMIGPGGIYEVNVENMSALITTLKAAIEQHESFKREVSDAVESRWMNILAMKCEDVFSRFIISKPDPLVDAWLDAFPGNHIDDAREECAKISAALAARGLEVRKIGEGHP